MPRTLVQVHVCFVQLGGPIWSAPMHNAGFVQGLLDEVKARTQDYYTAARIQGLLTVVSEVNIVWQMTFFACKGGEGSGDMPHHDN